MEQTLELTLPVEYIVDEFNGKEYHIIVSSDETKKFLDIPIVVQANSKEEAIKQFWMTANIHLDYLEERGYQADKWEPLRIGPWKKYGGRWVSIFGQFFSFRYGKKNKGGWFVPFTKLNISYHNQWRIKPKQRVK